MNDREAILQLATAVVEITQGLAVQASVRALELKIALLEGDAPPAHAKDAGLLPCPFCGTKGGAVETYNDKCWVECRKCGASTGRKSGICSAVEAWNKRAGGGA